MNESVHAVLSQVFLKVVAVVRKNREQVEYMAVKVADMRQCYGWICYAAKVHFSHSLATHVVLVEVFQLDIKYGCLNFVKSGVASFVAEHIFFR